MKHARIISVESFTTTRSNRQAASCWSSVSFLHAVDLKADAARAIVHEVALKIATWKEAFSAQGVTAHDIDLLAQYIDGDRLRHQRAAFGVG